MFRKPLVLATTTLVVAALTACSSSPTSKPQRAATAVASSAPRVPGRDTAAACHALVPIDAAQVAYPGADSDAPPPTDAQLAAWAATISTPLNTLAANVPDSLNAQTTTLQTAVEGAANGTPLNTEDGSIITAASALDKWGHDTCGFTKLDITNTGTALTGTPTALPAGPVSVSFTNSAPADKAAFVLLIARVKDNARYTLDQIRNNSVAPDAIADVVVAAQPGQDGSTAYATAQLTPGTYIVASPLGTPPEFGPTLANQFVVE